MAKYTIDANGNQVLEDQTDLNGSAAGGTADPFEGQSFTSIQEQIEAVGQAADEWAALKTEVEADQEQRATDFDEYMGGLTNDLFAHPDARLVRLRTAGGQATDFFRFPAITWGQLRPDSAEFGTITDMHEAFCDGTEAESGDHAFDNVYIAAYPLSLINGEVVSQPGAVPYSSRSFDEALSDCANTEIVGFEGLHRLWTIWDRSLVVNHCVREGHEPACNSLYGVDNKDSSISGVLCNDIGVVLTGSMGSASSHTGDAHGIYDLSGNLWGWCFGLETEDGQLKLVTNNAMSDRGSLQLYNHWFSHIDDGSGVEIVTTAAEQVQNGPTGQSFNAGANGFSNLANNNANSMTLRRALIVALSDSANPLGSAIVKTYDDCCLLVGGSYKSGASAGIGTLRIVNESSSSAASIGFRSAFAV